MAYDVRRVSDPASKLAKAFIEFPFQLYRNDRSWVPPLRRSIKAIIAKRHPFFKHSDAEAFLVVDGGRAVARYVMVDPKFYNAHTGAADARIMIPEAIDERDAWTVMLDHAREWSRARGASRVLGPRGFSPADGSGVQIEGFEHRATMTMMPYTARYYAGRFEEQGFGKHKDFVCSEVDARSFETPDKVRRVAEIARKRANLTVDRPRNRRELRAVAMEVARAYNEAWVDREESRPFTEAELAHTIDEMVLVSEPDLVVVLRNGERRLVGFVLTFPDLSGALQRSGGYVGIRTLLDIARERRRTRRFIVNGLGIVPEHRNNGGTALLYTLLEETLRRRNVESAEMTQIAETNDRMLADMRTLGGVITKRHRVYSATL
jgi:hypothetical protein